MAYIELTVRGNEDFGGYLSVDGSESILITNDMVYELAPGAHLFEVHSTSDKERKMGERQRKFNDATYTGSFIDRMTDRQATNAIGNTWSFSVKVADDEAVEILVVSRGSEIVDAPQYTTRQLSDEELAHYEEKFRELHEEEERIANTPRRHPKMMLIGALIALAFIYGCSNAAKAGDSDPTTYAVLVAGIIAGIITFILGFMKKVRK